MASDRSETYPEDVIAWGRLALELLRQAALEATGRGFVKAEVRASARTFFYSTAPRYIHHRHMWFSLAGIPVPGPDEMEECISRLRRKRVEQP